MFVASDHISDETTLSYNMEDVIEDFRSLPSCYAVIYDNHLVCIYRSESKYPLSNTQEWPFNDLLAKYHMRAGISAPLKNLSQIYTGYKQAQSMSNIASVLQNDGITYYPYDEFAFYHMMEVAEQRQGLKEFCHQKILDLEAYDSEHNTDLVPTLHVYLESYRSISHTAEVMFIHRNTVSYRINKCFELLGTRIESGSELFSFTFSLRIIEYYNKKKGKMPPF